jgi:hypothetical protein
LRRTLIDELGIEPSTSIQLLHRRILSGDPELTAPDEATLVRRAVVPRRTSRDGSRNLLPADTRVFTGRTRELDQLTALARTACEDDGTGAAVIAAIDGMAGIGKTALQYFPECI